MPGYMASARSAERHIIFGLFLCIAAFVLLLLVTFSVPFIKSIYYLHIPFQAGQLRFGNFGLCYIPGSDYEDGRADCIGPRLGYYWRPEIIHWLTEAQITVGIACAFSLIALVLLIMDVLCRPNYQLTNPVWFRLFAGLTAFTSILAFVFVAVLWYNARKRFEDNGIDAEYGPAEWMLLGAAIAAMLSLCVGGPRFTGRHMYRADNRAAYSV